MCDFPARLVQNMKLPERLRRKRDNRFAWMGRTERQPVSPEITRVYLELSTHCNLSCRHCMRNAMADLKRAHFSAALLDRVLPMLSGLGGLERVVLLGFGEALCNPRFREIVSALRRLPCRIVLVTNALLLDADMSRFLVSLPLDEVWCSWDDEPRGKGDMLRRGHDPASFRENLARLCDARAKYAPSMTVGMQVVASARNVRHLPDIVRMGREAWAGSFIISNVFPYTEGAAQDILYSSGARGRELPAPAIRKAAGGAPVRFASMNADVLRRCPFVERGTAFITVGGDVAPCPELAYTHPAWYFGSKRTHRRLEFGNVMRQDIGGIWDCGDFADFRKNFLYFDYPDCTFCVDPDMCWHRTVESRDCHRNPGPCGECLWAKGIVICP